MYLVRRPMLVRRRKLLFYSNGIQLQRVTRYLLDRISDVNKSIGPGGPLNRELTRWSAAGVAQILDQTPEGDFSEASENLRLYRSGVGHCSHIVVTRDIIRLHLAGLGRYAADEPSPVPESLPPNWNRRPRGMPSRRPSQSPPVFAPAASQSACGRHSRRSPESFRTT